MTLSIDTFSTEAAVRLIATGWSFSTFSRYDPTHIEGFTPTGKAFTLDMVGGLVTITVAGRTKTANVARATWEPGNKTVDTILSTWQLLPVNQR